MWASPSAGNRENLGLGCQPEHYHRGYHPTGSLGIFGAAAGAAKMLGLHSEHICMALGISASRAAGFAEILAP